MPAVKKPVTTAPTTIDEAIQAIRNLMPGAELIGISITPETYSMNLRSVDDTQVSPR